MTRSGFRRSLQYYIVHQKLTFTQKIAVSVWVAQLLRVLLVLPMLGLVSSAAPDDRHRILFTGQASLEDSDIFSIQPDGSGLRRVTRNLGVDSEPSRSGRFLVYTCGLGNQLDLCRSDFNGKNVVRLTQDEAIDLFPALSPNGQQLVWMSQQQQHHELYRLDAQGQRHQLTNNSAYDVSPSWSPDGQQLAFVSNRDGNYEIYRMTTDGKQVVRLTNDRSVDSAPAWSPDGQWIIYLREQALPQLTKSLYRMRPDGSQKTRLTDPQWHLSAPAWSADSQWIVFGAKDRTSGQPLQNCLWLMPAAGGPPIPYRGTEGLNPSGVNW
jgi:Tol biopolymer transport system component